MEKAITKIEVCKRNKDRVNVFLNDEFGFACSSDLVYYYKLKKGKNIDLDVLENVLEDDEYLKGKNYGLKIIEKSYKTEKEVYEKLINKGYSEKIVDKIIIFLKEYNFINDKKYTKLFVKEKILSYGRNKIKYTLIKKGIDEEIIFNELKDLDYNLEKDIALKIGKKKYDTLTKMGDPYNKIYKKLGNFLVSRGYDFDLVKNVLNEVLKKDKDTEYKNKDSFENFDLNELKAIANKRYNVLKKSESDNIKLYRKLGQYLLRRGYEWEDIKKILKEIIKDE